MEGKDADKMFSKRTHNTSFTKYKWQRAPILFPHRGTVRSEILFTSRTA